MTDDRAWAVQTADGPRVGIGTEHRSGLIPPDAARERARDLRAWLPKQLMGHGQHAEYLRFADELEQAADKAEGKRGRSRAR